MDSKEQKIRKITQFYYSNPKVQKEILKFSKNRETIPRYFEGFGKRPDMLSYTGDIFDLVKRGATSFHVSEELWQDPLKLSTNLNPKEMNSLRIGWDLLLDIDSKYLDYSKIMAQLIIKLFEFHGIKNFAIKFSGSKGFHIIVPWQAFPESIHGVKASDMFPEWPRIVTKYITEMVKPELVKKITRLTHSHSGASKYVRDFQASKEVMPDLILVSPRHLFRAPYSLHEKTRLASLVLSPNDLEAFQPKDADPLKILEMPLKSFLPEAIPGEASELLREALDWHKNLPDTKESIITGKDFKPINLEELGIKGKASEKHYPESVKKILRGMKDGRKRALFILLNFLRSVGTDREELEKIINEWNSKNEIPLPEGYIKTQLVWSFRKKPVLPPNFDKDYYKGLGINPSPEELRFKNPVNYTIRSLLRENAQGKPKGKMNRTPQAKKIKKVKDNFKNKS